jgi:hypothetical protein
MIGWSFPIHGVILASLTREQRLEQHSQGSERLG